MITLPWLLTVYVWGITTPVDGQPQDTLSYSPVDKAACIAFQKEQVDKLKAEHPTWQFGSVCSTFNYEDRVLYSR